MSEPPPLVDPSTASRLRAAARIRLGIVLTLQCVMAAELVVLLLQRSWASSAWLLAIMAFTGAPVLLRRPAS